MTFAVAIVRLGREVAFPLLLLVTAMRKVPSALDPLKERGTRTRTDPGPAVSQASKTPTRTSMQTRLATEKARGGGIREFIL